MDWIKNRIKTLFLSAKTRFLFAETLVRTPIEDQRVAVDLLNAMDFDQLAVTDPERWAAAIRDELRAVGEELRAELRAAELAAQGGEAGA